MLFNEPKLLKFVDYVAYASVVQRFSALQRAEIAEIALGAVLLTDFVGFSALQRAEIAETPDPLARRSRCASFSALQRAEIAETLCRATRVRLHRRFQCSSTSRNC